MELFLIKNHITKFTIAVFLTLIILQPILVYADQGTGSIEINLKYTNGDRADYSSMRVKIYQDFNTTPYKEISQLTANPYNIVSLPIGHKYKVEVYANDMYASTGYVDLQSTHELLDMSIPIPGGIRFNVYYNDGLTPIENATVSVKSQDGVQWTQSRTDSAGQTTRFWIQPPIVDSNYYIADVSIGKSLLYSFFPVKLRSGISQEIKIITPWPTVVNSLLTVQIFRDQSITVTSADGNFVVELYDNNGNKISESKANARGQAYFSNLKVGDYIFHAKNLNTNSDWGSSEVTIDGKQDLIQIIKNQAPQLPNPSNNQVVQTPNATKNIIPSEISNCQCVVFRLDNIQDYWLDNVQTRIIDTFQEKNASLTVGIIGNSFGNDSKLVDYIKDKVKTSNPELEVANNGWEFENFATHTEKEQSLLLKESNDKIFSLLGITPSVFIPPYGKINNDTFAALNENKITLLSTNTLTYHTTYSSSNTIHRFPATVATGYTSSGTGPLHRLTNDEIFTNIQNSLHDYGFAVVTISFQDYAMNNATVTQNEPDVQQIQQLGSLLDKVKSSGLKIVTVGGINGEVSNYIPSWIKNNAGWWANGQIADSDFIIGIQYMMQKHIIVIQNLSYAGGSNSQSIPSWIKNNAGWWAENKISDNDFVKGIQYLVQQGIIKTGQ